MTRVKQLALDVDVEMTAGSPFAITFTPTSAVAFTSPTLAYKTRGGDVVTGTAVPTVTTDGETVTLTWSTTCSAANNTTTAKQGKVYSFEVQATVNGVGPVPLFGGESTVWPVGVATSGVASSTSVTGTVNVGGVAITGTVNMGIDGADGDWSTAQPGRTITGTADTPTAADAGYFIDTTNGSAVTITINGSLNLATRQRIDFAQLGAGQVTFVGSGATVNGTPGLKLRTQYSSCSLICTAADTYLLVGDLAA